MIVSMYMTISYSTHNYLSDMQRHTGRCTRTECICVFGVLKAASLLGTPVWQQFLHDNCVEGFAMGGQMKELKIMQGKLKKYWRLIIKTIARRYWCGTGLGRHVMLDTRTLNVIVTASAWQNSTTWTRRCMPIHLHFSCIAKKYFFLMILKDGVGRLSVEQTSGGGVSNYNFTTHPQHC